MASLVLCGAPPRGLAGEGDACVTSYELSQQRRRAGDLVHAQAELRLCLGACPTLLARDCGRWLRAIESEIPRLSVDVRGISGQRLDDARVLVDGAPVPTNAMSRIEVNPGRRAVRVEAPGCTPFERQIDVEAGETTPLEVRLMPEAARRPPSPPSPPAPAADKPRSSLVAGVVIGAVGVLGLGTGAALGIAGHVERARLREACAPRCAAGDVDAVRSLWIAGGVTAGGGAVALAVGAGLIAARLAGNAAAPVQPFAQVDPGYRGGALGVTGRF